MSHTEQSRHSKIMGARFWCMSLIASWIFLFCFPSVFSEGEIQMRLESTVFVAFAGRALYIDYKLEIPFNHSSNLLICYDPFNAVVYRECIPSGKPETFRQTMNLTNLMSSGEYVCKYETASVFWFLRVTDEGYEEPEDNTEFITVTVLIGILLVFSVISSVFVFNGHWKEYITKCADRKQKQNKAEKEKEIGEDNEDAKTAPSTSFYASLDARPRSIYDVLDHSTANRDQRNVKPKKQEPKKTMVQSTNPQCEDVVDCVYENF